ncbi:Two Component Transcriptional Regulator, LuxR family [Nostoc sp. NIES-3756]|nr:response regulator transcription factor [Nostoc sp. NIES-3756]BAT53449.1 Two Component Transcriptional Regulator, LuxR family [Nostoc sp. NIES-3756]BAY38813.1 two component transcriptional regulator, LuxR family protein [Nostoc sp. NIES-2111]
MTTCQVERIEEAITFTLLPFHSSALGRIKDKRSVSALHPQNVMIRAVPSQKLRQIVEHPLTERELCVLKMIVDGNSNFAIAQDLRITVGTVKTHVRNILYKLNVDDRTQAAVVALRSGLVE